MEQNENYLDMIINSLKYAVSDLNALFWGGIAALGSMILIGIPFLFGYITRSGREVLRGNYKLPAWDNLGEAFKDGIMIILVMLFFGLISAILYVFVVPFFVIGAITGNDAMIAAGLFMLLPAIVITLVTCLLMPAAWITYAVTGDLFKALNPINALRLAARNPLAYIAAVVATLIVQILLSILNVLVITIPWTSFAGYASSAYIYAWFYKQTTTAAPVQQNNGSTPAAV
jgi:Protein of unknown function (DUF4013)